jgi:hypothetical protein
MNGRANVSIAVAEKIGKGIKDFEKYKLCKYAYDCNEQVPGCISGIYNVFFAD